MLEKIKPKSVIRLQYSYFYDNYPQLDAPTKGNKYEIKYELIWCLTVFYKQLIPWLFNVCKLFSDDLSLIHALLAS